MIRCLSLLALLLCIVRAAEDPPVKVSRADLQELNGWQASIALGAVDKDRIGLHLPTDGHVIAVRRGRMEVQLAGHPKIDPLTITELSRVGAIVKIRAEGLVPGSGPQYHPGKAMIRLDIGLRVDEKLVDGTMLINYIGNPLDVAWGGVWPVTGSYGNARDKRAGGKAVP